MHRDASRCALGAWCLIEMYSCRNIKDINVSDLSREPCRVVGSYWRHQDQQCSRRGVLLTPLRCLFQILLLLASTSTQTKMGYELHLILRRIFGSPELSLARPSSARHKSRCYSTRVLYNIRKHRYCAHCCSLRSSDAFVLSTCVARVALPTTDDRRPTTRALRVKTPTNAADRSPVLLYCQLLTCNHGAQERCIQIRPVGSCRCSPGMFSLARRGGEGPAGRARRRDLGGRGLGGGGIPR